MLNLFTKRKQVVNVTTQEKPKVATKTSDIIEQIHNEFYAAGDEASDEIVVNQAMN